MDTTSAAQSTDTSESVEATHEEGVEVAQPWGRILTAMLRPGDSSPTADAAAAAAAHPPPPPTAAADDAVQPPPAADGSTPLESGEQQQQQQQQQQQGAAAQDTANPFTSYYAQIIHQQNMLQDTVRTGTYRRAIVNNAKDFRCLSSTRCLNIFYLKRLAALWQQTLRRAASQ
jgi:hypothetical protein